MHLALIGFMGTGKTTLGRALGEKLAMPVVDTDAYIVAHSRLTIGEWFAQRGEEAFREAESEALAHILALPPHVIATGGGLPVREANRIALCTHAFVVGLVAHEADIVARVRKDDTRPLAQSGAHVRSLLASRKEAYACAHMTVHTSRCTVEEAVEAIARAYAHDTP